jgi:RHS repeat-associated protein
VAIDGAGNFYIADPWNDVIRKVTASGIISTIAGNGTCCYSGDGGAAANASLSYPQDVGVDAFGNVYIVDEGANRIRMVTAGANIISTFAGNGIGGYGGDGGQSTDAELYGPGAIAIDTAGNVYIADSNNYRIRAVGSRGTPNNPGAGYIITVAGDGVPGYSGNGGLATAAEINDMSGLAVDSSGNVYFADTIASVIRKVSASTGIISTVAGNGTQGFSGDGGAATSARLYSPHDIAVDSSGNLYIADSYNNRIRKVSSSGIISTIAGNGTAGFSGDNGPAINAELYYPASVVVDKAGNVYIGDTTNERIRKISTSGVISTYAGNGTQSFNGYGDGGQATSAEIDLGFAGLALDSSGNLYEAEYQRIREISASTGVITTVVGAGIGGYNGTFQGGLTVDGSGNVYFGAELSFVMEMKGGASTAVAGGVWTNPAGATSHGSGCSQETNSAGDGCPASEAVLKGPGNVALDSTGNLYILDYGNYRVRKVGALSGITKTTPTITWPTPANIPYGTPLSSTQLDATSTQGGTFVYSPPAGTVLALGSHTLSVTFTPANSTFYNTAGASVTLVVGMAPVPITWPAPLSMIYGTALSSAQLDASTTVAGTFAYSPASGTLLTAGSHTLSTTFTPTDTVDYTTTTTTVPVTVTKALPPITWPQPADIKYGTALNSTQLDATSTVAGSFAYTPVSGTVLSVGPHALLATLTPTDTTDYTTANLVAYLTVTPATNTFDSGTITLTVNGATAATTTYGSTSTPSTIAAGLSAGVSGSSPVTVTAVDDAIYLESKASGATTNYAYTLQTTTWNTTFTHPSFVYPAITSVLDGGQNLNAAGTTVYSYCVPGPTNPYCTAANNGYDAVGNLKTYTDTSLAKPLMGTWNFSYDSLNRVTLATDNQPANPSTNYCWGYDAFGNRTIQGGSNQAFAVGSPAAPGTSPCQPASGASFTSTWANYNTTANNNQFSSTSQAVGGVTYDGAGNITYDGVNQYLYDGDGRVCAVASSPIPGTTTLTGYIYGADGQRVAKGSITAWSCDPTLSGFKTINDYILGPSGEQVSEIGMNTATSTMVFQHTNVWAGGKLLATYDDDGIHFYFNDPLGTRRAQTDYAGVLEQTCSSLPFGDGQNCSNSTQFPTEHHFTGKERDAESGNDYFGARYYASTMGRFLSPDWAAKITPVPYAKLDNPQSLNLYSYVGNNPLSRVDKDGHCSSPSVGKGQVGVCIDLYIQAKTINVVGEGDGRGPAANDPKATYRVELQMVVDPAKGTVSLVKDDAGVSKALGGLVSNKGTDSTTVVSSVDDKGTTHIGIDNTAMNGLHDLPGAPKDTIKTTMTMDVTSDGKVGIEGGMRTAYPSMEVYSYDPSGKATTILQVTEHNPSDLANKNQPIPQVPPQ